MSMPIHRGRPQHTTLRPPVVPAFLHPLILYITPLLHPPSHTITLTNQQHLHCIHLDTTVLRPSHHHLHLPLHRRTTLPFPRSLMVHSHPCDHERDHGIRQQRCPS